MPTHSINTEKVRTALSCVNQQLIARDANVSDVAVFDFLKNRTRTPNPLIAKSMINHIDSKINDLKETKADLSKIANPSV
jgi:hypothetical protein